MGDGGEKKTQSAPARPTADELREQRAIAAAVLVGEQMRREDRKHLYWYAKRIGFFLTGFAFFILLMLFAMWRVRQDEFNPTGWMVVMAAVAAGGMALVYWAYAEDRRHKDH